MAKAAHVQDSTAAENEVEQSIADAPAFEKLTIDNSTAASASPAKRMQNVLGREFAAVEQAEQWSARRTVGFVICTCGAFWTAVYFVISALLG